MSKNINLSNAKIDDDDFTTTQMAKELNLKSAKWLNADLMRKKNCTPFPNVMQCTQIKKDVKNI